MEPNNLNTLFHLFKQEEQQAKNKDRNLEHETTVILRQPQVGRSKGWVLSLFLSLGEGGTVQPWEGRTKLLSHLAASSESLANVGGAWALRKMLPTTSMPREASWTKG